jgi:hypothetical protein
VDFIHPTVSSNSGEESRRQRWHALVSTFFFVRFARFVF